MTALWELADASGKTLRVDTQRILVPSLARRVCDPFWIDPLGAIASDALLITVSETDAGTVCSALQAAGIACADIGCVCEGPAQVEQAIAAGHEIVRRPEVDEITKAYV